MFVSTNYDLVENSLIMNYNGNTVIVPFPTMVRDGILFKNMDKNNEYDIP